MSDPRPLGDHVYQMWIDKQLEHVRNKGVLPREMQEEELFRSLYRESRVDLPGHPLHNPHINYYNHLSTTNVDITPVYAPSRFYWFRYLKQNIYLEYHTDNNKITDCVIWIENPGATFTKSLLSTCCRISELQSLSDLCMLSVRCKELPEHNRFNLSKNVQSALLNECTLPLATYNHLFHLIGGREQLEIFRFATIGRGEYATFGFFHVRRSVTGDSSRSQPVRHSVKVKNCTFPLEILNNLMQQIHSSSSTSKIDLHLTNAPCLRLDNKRLLSYLDLSNMPSFHDWWQNLFLQMSNLLHLEYINLSKNDLSQLTTLTLENKTSLSYLNLSQTQLSPEMWVRVCQEISHLVSLRYLNLSKNNLRQVSSLTLCNKPSLNYLNLKDTNMSIDVIVSVYQQIMLLENIENIYVTGISIDRMTYTVEDIMLPSELFGGELFKQMIKRFIYPRNISIWRRFTGSLTNFLPDSAPDLETLHLTNNQLNKEVLQHISMITDNMKSPKLRVLDLSGKSLTGCLSSFLPDPPRGLPKLKELNLRHAPLNKDDLQHLSNITRKNKFTKATRPESITEHSDRMFIQLFTRSSSRITSTREASTGSYSIKQRGSAVSLKYFTQ